MKNPKDEGRLSQGRPADLLRELARAASKLTSATKRLDQLVANDEGRVAEQTENWTEISAQVDALCALRDQVVRAREAFQEQVRRALLTVESDFRDACAKRGWRVDGEWPVLYVELAIKVEFHENSGTAVVGGSRVRHLDVPLLVEPLGRLIPTLLPKGHSADSFIRQLEEAYDQIAQTGTTQVPIWLLYERVVIRQQVSRFWKDARAEAFRGLTGEQFRARFSHLLENGKLTSSDGRLLRLLPPLDPKDAMFLYQPAEARFGYVGRVEFVSSTERT